MGYFSNQAIDETGKQAVKLQKGIFVVLIFYLAHIGMAFTLTSIYSTSIIGPIFSLVGLLVGIGILGASKRDHTMTCVYIGVLALELVLGLIGTALWVVEGIIIKDSTITALGLPDRSGSTPVNLAIALAATIPVAILINLYCLVQAAKLKIILKQEQKQLRAIAIEQRVQLLVQDLVMQQTHQMQQIPSMKPSTPAATPIPRRMLNRSTSSRYGNRVKNNNNGTTTTTTTTAPSSSTSTSDVAVDMPEGSSAM